MGLVNSEETIMPGPFPGMDPYLEKHWGDVHARLITYASDQLQKVLPRSLRARVEERVVVTDSRWARKRSLFPDVRVIETASAARRTSNGAVKGAVAEPLMIELLDEPETQTFVEIRDVTDGSRLITVLEVLSPSNKKPGETQDQYLRKQKDLIDAGVNLVEIDLLRAGAWILAVPIGAIEAKVRTPYRVAVRRGSRRLRAEYYPIRLRDRLPTINVPLRPTDADVPLDLQALCDLCYENGGYDDIDYRGDAQPPLHGAEARWAAQLLRRTGHRSRRKGK